MPNVDASSQAWFSMDRNAVQGNAQKANRANPRLYIVGPEALTLSNVDKATLIFSRG